MSRRHPNHRLVKIHRSYTVDEVAKLFGIHKNTVREWLKHGLVTCDDRRPILILGRPLIAFLLQRRAQSKRRCDAGQLYCFRCRAPRDAAGGIAEFQLVAQQLGNLVAICATCDTLMYRSVNPANLQRIRGNLDVSFPVTPSRLDETRTPTVNSDFKPRGKASDAA